MADLCYRSAVVRAGVRPPGDDTFAVRSVFDIPSEKDLLLQLSRRNLSHMRWASSLVFLSVAMEYAERHVLKMSKLRNVI